MVTLSLGWPSALGLNFARVALPAIRFHEPENTPSACGSNGGLTVCGVESEIPHARPSAESARQACRFLRRQTFWCVKPLLHTAWRDRCRGLSNDQPILLTFLVSAEPWLVSDATLLPLSELRPVVTRVASGFDRVAHNNMIFLWLYLLIFVATSGTLWGNQGKTVNSATTDQQVIGSTPIGCTTCFVQFL